MTAEKQTFDLYELGSDSTPQADIPKGEITKYHRVSETVYPGTARDY